MHGGMRTALPWWRRRRARERVVASTLRQPSRVWCGARAVAYAHAGTLVHDLPAVR